MDSDIPDIGHSRTGMGVRGGKPTMVEALKRGASRNSRLVFLGHQMFLHGCQLSSVNHTPFHLMVQPQALQLHLGGHSVWGHSGL
jgi:hypothetical protein